MKIIIQVTFVVVALCISFLLGKKVGDKKHNKDLLINDIYYSGIYLATYASGFPERYDSTMRALALNCYIRAENIDIGKELENNRLLREYFDMIKSEYSKKMNHAEKNP